jgi:hypothetical protein
VVFARKPPLLPGSAEGRERECSRVPTEIDSSALFSRQRCDPFQTWRNSPPAAGPWIWLRIRGSRLDDVFPAKSGVLRIS